MIMGWLDPGVSPGAFDRVATIYVPHKSSRCCRLCQEGFWKRFWERKSNNVGEPWSGWVLTQLSKAHYDFWHPYFFERTTHRICTGRLHDYMTTFSGAEGRKAWPAHRVSLVVDPASISHTSLHIMYEASKLLPGFDFSDPCDIWDDDEEGKRQRWLWSTAFRALHQLYYQGLITELLPGAAGAGKMDGLFIDYERNLWLHPAPGYLSSSPALDPALRNSLYELWCCVPVRFIYLLLIPSEKRRPVPRMTHQFRQHLRYKNFIRSVRHLEEPADAFIVQPCSSVLPEEYSLANLCGNQRHLRKFTGLAVYMQLVSPDDDEFPIRLEGPHNPQQPVDEDFRVAGTDATMTDPSATFDSDDDDESDEDDESDDDDTALDPMSKSDIINLEKDLTVSLESLGVPVADLLKYGQRGLPMYNAI